MLMFQVWTWPFPGKYPLCTVYPKKYSHGFVVLCFVVVMQSFTMNSHEVFIHIHQGCFAGTGAIVRLPQCQWSKPDGYGKISQCITTTKHSKAKTVCIFLGIYCNSNRNIAGSLTVYCTPTSTKLNGGKLVSRYPSVCLSVRLWMESCLLCIFRNTCLIQVLDALYGLDHARWPWWPWPPMLTLT